MDAKILLCARAGIEGLHFWGRTAWPPDVIQANHLGWARECLRDFPCQEKELLQAPDMETAQDV